MTGADRRTLLRLAAFETGACVAAFASCSSIPSDGQAPPRSPIEAVRAALSSYPPRAAPRMPVGPMQTLDLEFACSRPVRVLHAWRGSGRACLGRGVAVLGDVDGDHVPDVAIGATYMHNFATLDPGSVAAYSGATGALLWSLEGWCPRDDQLFADALGRSLCPLGDVDGDGACDLAVAAWEPRGSVRVLSGRNGAVLSAFELRETGTWLAGSEDPSVSDVVVRAGDLDRDGANDYLVHVLAGELERERTIAVSGRSGGRLLDVAGRPLSSTGDVDGDDVPDFFVAPDGRSHTSSYFGLYVDLLSGRDEKRLADLTPRPVHERYEFAGSAGDLDHDGFDDRLTVVPVDGAELDGGVPTACLARIHSGRDGHLLLELPLSAVFDGRVGIACNVGDVDGDGTDDFWFTCRHGNGGAHTRVVICSGVDGTELVRIEADEWIGQRACGIGDLDGDGRAEVLVGDFCASSHDVWESGRAYVLSFPER